MEELLPKLSNLLNNTIEIRENKEQLLIELKIKKKRSYSWRFRET